jgi:hypothetical protein
MTNASDYGVLMYVQTGTMRIPNYHCSPLPRRQLGTPFKGI